VLGFDPSPKGGSPPEGDRAEPAAQQERSTNVKTAWLALSLAVLLVPTAYAGELMIHVGHNKLDPAEASIAVGDTVVFHNLDEMPGGHTIVADDGSFESPGLAKDASWSHTFETAGTYSYHIKEHPAAKGKIIVK
jgi:plastocyanin